jgi:5-oxoprolinase (ATP-hydrolysing) subunit A
MTFTPTTCSQPEKLPRPAVLSQFSADVQTGCVHIDLNADLGEGVTDDEALLRVVTSANVACGFHAGDEDTMRAVCTTAAARGVVVGAQVSYDDREGFGRRHLDPAPDVLSRWVRTQIDLLQAIAAESGLEVAYVKPHGALYNRVVDDTGQASAVLAGSGDLPVLGLPGGELLRLAKASGRGVVPEGFPDRGYTTGGRLVPRGDPGALVTDPAEVAVNAVRLARSGAVESVCVHGDSPGAVTAALAVRAALEDAGVEVRRWAKTGE